MYHSPMTGTSISVQEVICDLKKLGYNFKNDCVCVPAHTCAGATVHMWKMGDSS